MSCPVHAGFDPLSEAFLRDQGLRAADGDVRVKRDVLAVDEPQVREPAGERFERQRGFQPAQR